MAAGDLSLAITITAIDQATNIVKQIASSISDLAGGGALGAVVTGAAAAATALVGVGVEATKAAGDFQQQMSTLVTSAGELQGNLKMVSDGILQISTDTGTTTQQLTSAMYNIESGGQHGAAGLSILKTAAEGAKTENADLTTVTKALMTTMTDYHIPADGATAAMNGLIAAVKNGRTTLQEMASAMGQVLPVASSMGMSFPQVAGALDALTNAGISAQQGAQNLAHWMVALQAPSKVAQSAMISVGLSAQNLKDTLVSKGLPAALQLIEDHIGQHLPAGSIQAETAMKNITGGLVGLKSAAAITSQGLQKTVDATNAIADAMKNAGGGVSGWDIVQGNLNFQLDRASAALNALMIVIGEKLLPIVTPIVQGFANIVEQITSMISSFDGAGQSGSGFSGILNALGINSQTFQHILDDLYLSMHLLGSIFGEVGAALQSVFGSALQAVGGIIANFVNHDLAGIIEGFNLFLSNIKDALPGALSAISDFVSQAVQVFGVLAGIFDDLSTNAQTWGSNFMTGFGNGVMTALDGIVSVVMQVITEIESYLGFASPTRKGPGRNIYKWGLGLAQGMATGMTQGIPLLTDAAGNMMTATVTASTINAPQGISHASPSSPSSASSAVKPATTGLATALNSGAGAVSAAAKNVGSQLNQICHTHAQSTSACASHNLTTGLATKLKSGASAVKAAADTVGKATTPIADHAAKTAATTAKHLATIPKAAKKAAADTAAAVAGALPQAMQLGESPIKAATDKINSAIDSLGTHAKNAADAFKVLGPAAQFVKQVWEQVSAAVQQAIAYMTPGILSIWRVIQTQLVPAFNNLWNTIKPLIVDIGKLTVGVGMAVVAFVKWLTSASTLKAIWDAFVVVVKIVIVVVSLLVNALAKALQPVITQLHQTFQQQLVPAFQSFVKNIQPALPALEALAKFVGGVLLLALGVLVSVLAGLLVGIGQFIAGLIKALGGVAEIVSGVVSFIIAWFGMLYDALHGNWKKVGDDWTAMWNSIVEIGKGLGDTLGGVIDAFIGLITGTIGTFITTIISYFQNLYDALVGHSIVPDMINGILDWFQKLVDAVPTLINNIVKYFKDGFTTVLKNVADAWKQIQSTFTSAVAAAEAIVVVMWQKIQAIFNSAYQTYIVGPLNTIKSNLTGWFNTLATSFGQWGANMIKMFAQSITAGIPAVTQAATGVANVIKSLLGIASPAQTGPLSTADKWIPNLMNMFTNQIKAGTPAVTNATNQLAQQVQQKITDMVSKVQQAITGMTDSLNGVKTNLQAVTSEVQSGISTLNSNVMTASNQVQATLTNLNTQVQTASTNALQTVNTLSNNIATTMKNVVASVNTQANQANGVSDSTVTYARSTQKVTMSTNSIAAADTKNTMSTTENLISQMRSMTGDFAGYMHNFQTESSSQLNDTATREQQQGTSLIAGAYQIAAAVQSILGHSVPSQGPMKDDDQWTAHFIDNLVQPMIAGAPRVAAAANTLAVAMAGATPPKVSSTTTAPTVGSSQPIVVQVTMDGSVNLDGKSVGKYVTSYLGKEIRAQGGVRNR